ncbi:hypothetical protein J6590_057528 [Homalodisca vitripennis]|nr:hypothetical protein J6590_057528 [Homalodisca vitripennis]
MVQPADTGSTPTPRHLSHLKCWELFACLPTKHRQSIQTDFVRYSFREIATRSNDFLESKIHTAVPMLPENNSINIISHLTLPRLQTKAANYTALRRLVVTKDQMSPRTVALR